MLKKLPFVISTVVVTSASAVLAQDAPATDCANEFASFDTDLNGRLSEAEAAGVYARARIDGLTVDAEGMTAEQYASICGADHWQAQATEEGAPFEGANSFTEEQAKDRALSWNYTEVSALQQDDKGIWRGTAKHGDAVVNIAIDYKGNVVATPQ